MYGIEKKEWILQPTLCQRFKLICKILQDKDEYAEGGIEVWGGGEGMEENGDESGKRGKC